MYNKIGFVFILFALLEIEEECGDNDDREADFIEVFSTASKAMHYAYEEFGVNVSGWMIASDFGDVWISDDTEYMIQQKPVL